MYYCSSVLFSLTSFFFFFFLSAVSFKGGRFANVVVVKHKSGLRIRTYNSHDISRGCISETKQPEGDDDDDTRGAPAFFSCQL
ncbi:hypothetical protein BDP55DRAFT_655185, partial [Colletotrichum godetiae]